MKRLNRAFHVSLILMACLQSIYGQPTNSSAPSPQLTLLRQLREMAAASYVAFQAEESEHAAEIARSLERAWDTGSPLTLIAPDLSEATDQAMDSFVGPIKSHVRKSLDGQSVKVAYEGFLAKLGECEHALSDQSLAVEKTQSGVIYMVTKPTTGRRPNPGEIVVLSITGFANGVEFRRTRDERNPDWVWLLGDRQPPGLLEGLTLLHAGESAIIVVPPGLGYGPKGARHDTFSSEVPPSAQLTYFVTVLDVKSRELDDLLLQTIKVKGIDAAIEQFRMLREEGFPDVYCNEGQVNALGYDLLKSGDVEGAIKILKQNAETFSKSANVYDSLGEAYAKSGQREEAIASYKKALAIDPNMESSVSALKQLEGK